MNDKLKKTLQDIENSNYVLPAPVSSVAAENQSVVNIIEIEEETKKPSE